MAAKSKFHAYELTWVTDNLAVGSAPMSPAQLDSIHDQGVNAILNLCGEFCDLHDLEEEAGFEVHYLPLDDEEAPDLTEMEKALSWLDEAIYLGKKVLIHCRHGIGRTGTVLNAYLLRRGLGHKLAGKMLKKFRSKPANFDQWWTVRKYGQKSGKLTIREPSLEFKQLVDLTPFFRDYEELVIQAESHAPSNVGRCGLSHTRCCARPVNLSLAEAVHLSHIINTTLSSEQRVDLIEKAVETAGRERTTASQVDSIEDYCLSEAGAVCPLLAEGRCLVFVDRPLMCRTYEMDAESARRLWDETIDPKLAALSRALYLAFASEFPPGELPRFPLPDVVSGKYVERFFHYLLKSA